MADPATKGSRSNPDSRQTQMAGAFRNFQQCIQYCEKAVFFTDAAGILQRVNPAFEKLTGFASTESVGKDLSWLTAEGPSSEGYRRIWQEIFENRTFRGTLQVRRKDGGCVQMELAAVPVRDHKGQIMSLVCTGVDLRERSQRGQPFQTVSNLANTAVHEFNNLLMVISSHAMLALDLLPPEHAARKNLEAIKAASQRGSELTGKMRRPGESSSTRAAGAGTD